VCRSCVQRVLRGQRGQIVSRSSDTARLLCALGSWARTFGPTREWDMAGAMEIRARSGEHEISSQSMHQNRSIHRNTWPQMIETGITVKIFIRSTRGRESESAKWGSVSPPSADTIRWNTTSVERVFSTTPCQALQVGHQRGQALLLELVGEDHPGVAHERGQVCGLAAWRYGH